MHKIIIHHGIKAIKFSTWAIGFLVFLIVLVAAFTDINYKKKK
jgi:hypothetical protein